SSEVVDLRRRGDALSAVECPWKVHVERQREQGLAEVEPVSEERWLRRAARDVARDDEERRVPEPRCAERRHERAERAILPGERDGRERVDPIAVGRPEHAPLALALPREDL